MLVGSRGIMVCARSKGVEMRAPACVELASLSAGYAQGLLAGTSQVLRVRT